MTLMASAQAATISALATAAYSTGLTDRVAGKVTQAIVSKLLFAQGWQWAIEIDGMYGMDFFAKDITYGRYVVETEELKVGGGVIQVPTGRSAAPVTLMVRDTVDGMVQKWFDACQDKVVNADGTVNMPEDYTLNIRIYKVIVSGATLLETELKVFPIQRGETTRSRDQVTEFLTYPLTFAHFSTFEDSSDVSLLDAISYTL